MNETEDAGRRLYEACLSGSVPELKALIEKDRLILDRVSSQTCYFFNDTPLHVAALRGHLDLTKDLLARKPKLATELDLLRCSPLHLASAEGYVEIVQELLRVDKSVCFARDQDGRIPLHLAAMKGRIKVIEELLKAEPNSIKEKLGKGETVLHLCVKYNKLETLKSVVTYLQGKHMDDLLNSQDDDGNTVLHLAAALKQIDTIKFLLAIESVKDRADVKNRNGSTPLDIVEYCPNRDVKTMEIRELLAQVGVCKSINPPLRPPPPTTTTPQQPWCYERLWRKYFKVGSDWLHEVRGHLITASTLTATMAYQAILSPPGGFWQDSNGNRKAGLAVMDSYHSELYATFLLVNTAMLIASLSTIMLALSGFQNKFLIWWLILTGYMTLSCMAGAYVMAVLIVFPEVWRYFNVPWEIFSGLLYCWIGICGIVLVLLAGNFLLWLRNKSNNLGNTLKKFPCLGKKGRTSHEGGATSSVGV